MTSLIAPEILKTYTRGRVRTPPARREALLDEFERGGTSMAQFAKLVGVKYPTFALWGQKRRQQRASGAPVGAATPQEPRATHPVRLWEAIVEPSGVPVGGGGLGIELPGGVRICLERDSQVALAVALLAQLGPALPRAVLSFTGGLKVYLALEPCDFRKSFNAAARRYGCQNTAARRSVPLSCYPHIILMPLSSWSHYPHDYPHGRIPQSVQTPIPRLMHAPI